MGYFKGTSRRRRKAASDGLRCGRDPRSRWSCSEFASTRWRGEPVLKLAAGRQQSCPRMTYVDTMTSEKTATQRRYSPEVKAQDRTLKCVLRDTKPRRQCEVLVRSVGSTEIRARVTKYEPTLCRTPCRSFDTRFMRRGSREARWTASRLSISAVGCPVWVVMRHPTRLADRHTAACGAPAKVGRIGADAACCDLSPSTPARGTWPGPEITSSTH